MGLALVCPRRFAGYLALATFAIPLTLSLLKGPATSLAAASANDAALYSELGIHTNPSLSALRVSWVVAFAMLVNPPR